MSDITEGVDTEIAGNVTSAPVAPPPGGDTQGSTPAPVDTTAAEPEEPKTFTEVEMFEATTKAFVKGIAEGRKLAMKEFQEEAREDARYVDLREGFER